MFKYIVALAFLASTYAVTPVTQCENGYPLTTEVDFNGCTAEPCPVQQGTVASMNVTFTATTTTDTLHVEVLAFALGITTNYPLPESDGCKLLTNTVCPVAEGEEVTIHTAMEILTIFPTIPVALDFIINDKEGGQGIACFHVNAEVVSGF